MAHYNTFQIARGNKSGKTPAYGELFYDTTTKGIYVGKSDNTWQRIGGFDTLVFKGIAPATVTTIAQLTAYAITQSSTSTVTATAPEAGDAYILTADINADKDEGYRAGDLVIYTGVTTDTTGSIPASGWFDLNGGDVNSDDIKYAASNAVTAASHTDAGIANSTHATTADTTAIDDVKSALTKLFNTKLEYYGRYADNVTTTLDTTGIPAGTFVFYSGATATLTDSTILRKNSYIAHEIIDGADAYFIIPGGAASASDLDFAFTGTRADVADNYKVSSLGDAATGTAIDAATTSVQKALDNLHETKADLMSNGKIPIGQIPSTLVGALQYKGTVYIGTVPTGSTGVAATDGTAYTTATFAALVASLTGWETSSDTSSTAASALDAGDYFIFSQSGTVTIDGVTYNAGDWAIYNGTGFDILNASASVDNVNGKTGTVTIAGNTRSVDSATVNETSVDNSGTNIVIKAPNAVLEPTDLPANTIPVAGTAGEKSLEDSGLKLLKAKTGTPASLSDGSAYMQLPSESGKVVVVPATGTGTENTLPKFDANGGVIDSMVKQNAAGTGLLVGSGTVGTPSAGGFNVDTSSSTDGAVLATANGDGVDSYQFDLGSTKSAHSNRTRTTTTPNVLLDDESTIDCGEWV